MMALYGTPQQSKTLCEIWMQLHHFCRHIDPKPLENCSHHWPCPIWNKYSEFNKNSGMPRMTQLAQLALAAKHNPIGSDGKHFQQGNTPRLTVETPTTCSSTCQNPVWLEKSDQNLLNETTNIHETKRKNSTSWFSTSAVGGTRAPYSCQSIEICEHLSGAEQNV